MGFSENYLITYISVFLLETILSNIWLMQIWFDMIIACRYLFWLTRCLFEDLETRIGLSGNLIFFSCGASYKIQGAIRPVEVGIKVEAYLKLIL